MELDREIKLIFLMTMNNLISLDEDYTMAPPPPTST